MIDQLFRGATNTVFAFGLLLTSQAPAAAASMVFSGSAMNQNSPAAPDPSCAPLPLRVAFGPSGTSGMSNFGAFTYAQSHCTAGPGPYGGGAFQFFFTSDMFSGSYSGVLSPTGTPGLLNNAINYVIEQGTGRFQGATGTINGVGTLDARLAMPLAALSLNGSVNTVPEPGAWVLLIVGFGAVGGAMRRRNATLSFRLRTLAGCPPLPQRYHGFGHGSH